jgi:hypothetical protein
MRPDFKFFDYPLPLRDDAAFGVAEGCGDFPVCFPLAIARRTPLPDASPRGHRFGSRGVCLFDFRFLYSRFVHA